MPSKSDRIPSILFQLVLLSSSMAAHRIVAETVSQPLTPRLKQVDGTWIVEIVQGNELIGAADAAAPAGLEMRGPDDDKFRPIAFREQRNQGQMVELGPAESGPFSLRLQLEPVGPGVLRRTLVITSREAARFTARWSLAPTHHDTYASFSREERDPIVCDSIGGGPEYPTERGESIPVAMARNSRHVIGVLADSPGLWENRFLVEIDPTAHRLAVMCGDGRAARELRIVNDARDAYVGQIDGWCSQTQRLENLHEFAGV